MKTFYLLILTAFFVSCRSQNGRDVPEPEPEKVIPTASFRVICHMYDHFNQLILPSDVGGITVSLKGDAFQKDTVLMASPFFSYSQVVFEGIPVGAYELALKKEGFAGETRSFTITYENNTLMVEDSRIRKKHEVGPAGALYSLKMGEISTLVPGRLEPDVQYDQNFYVKLDTSFAWRGQYVRLFMNKGTQVSPQNYRKTYAYFINNPYIKMWRNDLGTPGLQKGDTISIVAYGDNYVGREMIAPAAFPCLSRESTNVVTMVLQ